MTTLALYFGWFDPLYFIILAPAMLLGLWAQFRVKATYANASQMAATSRVTGAEAAQMILDSHNIKGVGIEMAHGGELSDHYDPKAKMLRLSEPVYHGHSVAALGIAAHEAGHAIQDHVHYAPLKLRNGIVPLASIGSNLSFFMILIGGGMAASRIALGEWMVWGGILLFGVFVLFQLINLPVEFDASRRAKDLMQSSGLVAAGDEARAMNKVLNAAALTYVAATLSAILTLVYFILRSGVLNDRR